MSDATPREFTGRHMAIITFGAFGIIIAVNLTLAWFATSTFAGLEVRNSYVASQQFDTLRRAQEALGWEASVVADGTTPVIAITRDGKPTEVRDLEVRVGRPTHGRDDLHFTFERLWTETRLDAALEPGLWRVDLDATAPDGTAFSTRHTIFVEG